MDDETIITDSEVGSYINSLQNPDIVNYLMFNNQRIALVEKITIGRDSDNSVVMDNKLASRHHALIQKIKDDYYLKDAGSTNGTGLNGQKIPADKYVKLKKGDRITIGSETLIFS
ncbi:MAG: FHA domain-containing protein [Treponema sp.]|nr:FHA domain-containing protein [Treponema sp.]